MQLEGLPTSVRLERSGVTASLLGEGAKEGGGGADLHLGVVARGRHCNEGFTIKSQMGGGGPMGGPWCEWEREREKEREREREREEEEKAYA